MSILGTVAGFAGLGWVRWVAAGVVVAGAAAGGATVDHWYMAGKLAKLELAIATNALHADQAERETESLRRKARDRSLDNAHAQTIVATRAATAADRTADQLRQHIAALAAERQAGGNPAPLGGSESAGPAILVRTDVLGWLESEGRAAVAAIDRFVIARQQCEAEYNAVRTP